MLPQHFRCTSNLYFLRITWCVWHTLKPHTLIRSIVLFLTPTIYFLKYYTLEIYVAETYTVNVTQITVTTLWNKLTNIKEHRPLISCCHFWHSLMKKMVYCGICKTPTLNYILLQIKLTQGLRLCCFNIHLSTILPYESTSLE